MGFIVILISIAQLIAREALDISWPEKAFPSLQLYYITYIFTTETPKKSKPNIFIRSLAEKLETCVILPNFLG